MQQPWPQISERARIHEVTPSMMDYVWENGWRHFGRDFFRDSITLLDGRINKVTPLRLYLTDWSASKSERRTLNKNIGFKVEVSHARMRSEDRALFQRHKNRFTENQPVGLENFLGWQMADYPCECIQFSIYDEDKLIATSYLDIGEISVSSVYGMFDPEYSKFRLGIYTMLLEIQYAQTNGFKYYYSGYATEEPSCYDYKKSFKPQEYYRWNGHWFPLEDTSS